jgi:threonine aldolase
MASHSGESKDPRYDRDAINTVSKDRPNKPTRVVQLSRFIGDQTPAQVIQQTADYARQPRIYLESTLGNKVLTERDELLCTPEKIDRDYYGVGEHKTHFEQHIAKLFGKEHSLFFITGVQAQLAAMKIHSDRAGKTKMAWHVTSHLEGAEEAAYKELYGLDRTLLGSDPHNLPTVDEIKDVLAMPEEDRPAAILIEIPNRELGCQTYSYSELEAISSACRETGVKFHMDGARIWEIEPYYQENSGKSFADIGKLFDSMYVSFYKGLRGSTGAMLLGPDAAFIDEAKKWQRRAGGNAFQLTYEVLDCERGYNENIGTFDSKWRKMKEVVDGATVATSKYKNDEGELIVQFWPENATCCQIRTIFHGFTNDELTAARDGVAEKMGVRVFERLFQRPRQQRKEAVTEATDAGGNEDKLVEAEIPKTAAASGGGEDDKRYMIEWMIVKATLKVDTKLFVDAYVSLCEELLAAQRRRLV